MAPAPGPARAGTWNSARRRWPVPRVNWPRKTGLQALALHAGPFTSDVFEADGRHYVTLFIHATATSGEPRVTEPDKCERWDWFDPQALPQPLFAPVRSLLAQGPLAAP